MRIALLTKANSWHAPARLKYFIRKEYSVYYFGIEPGGLVEIPKGVRYFNIDSKYSSIFLRIIETILKVRKLTKRLQIDVFHCLGMRYAIYVPFVKAKKIVIQNNGSDILVWPKNNLVIKLLYRLLYRFADGVIQDSKIVQESAIRYGAPTKHNEIIELGIDFDIFNLSIKKQVARRKLGIGNEKVVFSPRGFTKIYSIDTIIKSIPKVKKFYQDVKFVFCNHFGDLEVEYKKLAEDLHIGGSVIFTGYLDNEKDMPYFYADADVVVSVPLSDSSPRSVYEAMACGTPTIITELPWYHGKFIKDRDLLTVPLRDEDALSREIINILDGKKVIDINCVYDKVRNKIDINKHSQKMEKFYRNL